MAQCIKPIIIRNPSTAPNAPAGLLVPCGKCYACLQRKRSEKVLRLTEEYYNRPLTLFVTLTYDDAHLPADHKVNKRDPQLFLKRLRKNSGLKLSYFLCSEYGTKFGRPHYHALLFLHQPNTYDTVVTYIEQAWQLGNIRADFCNDARINYVTKYLLKQSTHDTFVLQSKKPAIGASLLQDSSKCDFLNTNGYMVKNGYKYPVPRYYRKKLNPDKIFTQEESEQQNLQTLQQWQEKRRLIYSFAKDHNMSYEDAMTYHMQQCELLKQIKYNQSKQTDEF